MSDFSWEYVGTVAGASVVVMLIVQLISSIAGKELNKWWLRFLTYIISVAVLDIALFFVGWNMELFALNFLNALVVYFTATGEYHTVLKEIKERKAPEEHEDEE